jgi:hypothetical protein
MYSGVSDDKLHKSSHCLCSDLLLKFTTCKTRRFGLCVINYSLKAGNQVICGPLTCIDFVSLTVCDSYTTIMLDIVA